MFGIGSNLDLISSAHLEPEMPSEVAEWARVEGMMNPRRSEEHSLADLTLESNPLVGSFHRFQELLRRIGRAA